MKIDDMHEGESVKEYCERLEKNNDELREALWFYDDKGTIQHHTEENGEKFYLSNYDAVARIALDKTK